MAERVFAMPDLGEGLAEGEIVAWLVSTGDAVELNQPLVEVETAKATVEIPSPFAGRVAGLHAEPGDVVSVGHPLVTFEVAGAVVTTPAIRRLAKDLGVELSSVTGSGPGGRIADEDVRRAAGDQAVSATAGADEAAPARDPHEPAYDIRVVTAARRTIAQRLTASVREIPHVTTFRTLDCTALSAVRTQAGVSPLPVFVKALAETCRSHPVLHSSYHADLGEIHVPRACHVGVATDTERGLTVPVVRDVWTRSVGDIHEEIRRLAGMARGGALRVEDLAGGTISVSNTGSYGSEAGTPIINPGEGAVVALGVIGPRALVLDGEVRVRAACTLSLSFDHRLMDGAEAGRALTSLVELLQDDRRLRDLAR